MKTTGTSAYRGAVIPDVLRSPRPLHLALVAVFAALIVFLPHAGNEFVTLDDATLIYKNPASQQISPRSISYAFSSFDPELYVPLTLMSYQVDHAVYGLNPWGFHVTNILIHAANAALVVLAAWLLTGRRWAAFLCGLLFALHPLQTEAVLWAAARKDTLSGFFFLLTVVLYLISRRKDVTDKQWYWASVGTFFLGLLAKVSIIPLPLVLFAIDWVKGRRPLKNAVPEKIPYLILSAVFGIVAMVGKSRVIAQSNLWETILLSIKSTAFMLWKIVMPSGFSVIYPQVTPVAPSGEFLISGLVVLMFLALMIFALLRSRLVTFCLSLFPLMLLPSFTTFTKNGFLFFASDRYAYLAVIGLFLIIGLGIDRLARLLPKLIPVISVIMVMLFGGLVWQTSVQAGYWKDSETLYRRVLALYPQSTMAFNNLGDVLWDAGKQKEAEEQFRAALELDPDLMAARVNMARVFAAKGDAQAAIDQYRKAVTKLESKTAINVDEAATYYLLAQALENSGKPEEALKMWEAAASRAPSMGEPHYNLGLQYQKLGRRDDAVREFETASMLDRSNADALYHLAGLYAEAGRLPEALEALERVLRINPEYPRAAEHAEAIRGMLIGG